MSLPNGRLDRRELAEHVQSGQVETVMVAFPDLYGRLVGKRFEAHHFVEAVAHQGTHACDYLLTADMEMEPVAGYPFANWQTGYGDVHLTLDWNTARQLTWLNRTAFIFADVHGHDGQLVRLAPRSLLRAQIQEAQRLGYRVMAGSEVEYYVFRTSYRDAASKHYGTLEPAGWYIEDYHLLQGSRLEDLNAQARRHLTASGVPVECTKGEWGLGQHELNLCYADVLEMADRHTLYKQCLKEIADSQQASVTFMAKFDQNRAGSSCHLHVSLWHEQHSAFVGSQPLGGTEVSDTFRWFLGGWMRRTPELMAFYAPTINAYKRYRAGSWAPTRLGWCRDNRTAGFRVVGAGPSLRIESRIPGADCNPYLAYAAALASGLDGIAHQVEPPDEFVGNVYEAAEVPRLAGSLHEAVERLEASEFAREAFGADVVEHYVHFFRSEQAAFDTAVTDWERQRYFERI